MGPSNKSIGIGSVSIESHHLYITNWEENRFMDGIKYVVVAENVFVY
ncbi:hypothetical protein Gotur_002480 [Gossypium turneri]